jgi:hypothetical protein
MEQHPLANDYEPEECNRGDTYGYCHGLLATVCLNWLDQVAVRVRQQVDGQLTRPHQSCGALDV